VRVEGWWCRLLFVLSVLCLAIAFFGGISHLVNLEDGVRVVVGGVGVGGVDFFEEL